MITYLIDHDVEGPAAIIFGTLVARGWLALAEVQFVTFREAGITVDSTDRGVWRFAQGHQMLLLTANRSMKGVDSLEQTLREEHTAESLPVVTIARIDRLDARDYRERCAARLMEIAIDLDQHRGRRRIFIP